MTYRTDKQASYLDSLSQDMFKLAVEAERLGVPRHESFTEAARAVVDALSKHKAAHTLTKADASKAIDYVIAANQRMREALRQASKSAVSETSKTASAELRIEAGMYHLGPDIVRVYLGQQSGQMLAKKIVSDGIDDDGEARYRYEYMGKASRLLDANTPKLSLEDAKMWGKMTGSCCVCARRLDVPESVDAGIGPVCAKRCF